MEATKLSSIFGLAEALSKLGSACKSWKPSTSRDFLFDVADNARQLASDLDRINVDDFKIEKLLRESSENLRRYSETIENYTINKTIDPSRTLFFRNELVSKLESIRELYEELQGREVLIQNQYYLKYQSLQSWPYPINEHKIVYQYAPRTTKLYLSEAGKCLASGACRGAATLSFQAVEAMLRYYYLRCNGPNKDSTWGSMLEWLGGKKRGNPIIPEKSRLHRRLKDLLDERNTFAHGRNFPGAEDQEVIERILKESFEVVRDLIFNQVSQVGPSLSRLDLSFHVNPELDFDSVLALFILKWNPELPDFGSNQVTFDPELDRGCIKDITLPEVLVRTEGVSLSKLICEHIHLLPNYRIIVDQMISLAGQKINNSPMHSPVTSQKADLADLFEGILEKNGDDPVQTLINTWDFLEKYLETPNIHPNSDDLIEELDAQDIFQNCIRRRRRLSPPIMSTEGAPV